MKHEIFYTLRNHKDHKIVRIQLFCQNPIFESHHHLKCLSFAKSEIQQSTNAKIYLIITILESVEFRASEIVFRKVFFKIIWQK